MKMFYSPIDTTDRLECLDSEGAKTTLQKMLSYFVSQLNSAVILHGKTAFILFRSVCIPQTKHSFVPVNCFMLRTSLLWLVGWQCKLRLTIRKTGDTSHVGWTAAASYQMVFFAGGVWVARSVLVATKWLRLGSVCDLQLSDPGLYERQIANSCFWVSQTAPPWKGNPFM